VAEIRGTAEQAEQDLVNLPLMPAPAPGTKQFLTLRQVRDMLEAGGLPVAEHRFTGASHVVLRGETPLALQQRIGRLTSAQLQRVEEDLRGAIAAYLDDSAGDEPWRITVKLEEQQLRQLAEASIPWTITGGSAPWTGPQALSVFYETPGGTAQLAVEAEVALPEPVVVVTTPLRRGMTLGRADVTLERLSEDDGAWQAEDALHSVDEVVGKVAKRTLREGQVLTSSMIEEPTLVRRGQTVRVVALGVGIRVTMFARARQPGTKGALIYVETLDTREPFAAQVSGMREVQVVGR
jgi:flagella basal body P-ring formation protein FlgA